MKRILPVVVSLVALGSFALSVLVAGEPESKPARAPSVAAPMPGLKVGDAAPDAQVALTSGDPVQLADLYKKGPIVLVFYRGGWCPYCNKALAGWDEHLAQMSAYGALIIAVTPEGPEFIDKTVTDQKLRYAVLSDYKSEAAAAFGIGFEMPAEMQEKYRGYGVDLSKHNWDKSWKLPHPAAYVIDRGGTVRYAYCKEDYKVRADPAEVLAVLKAMAEEKAEAAKKK